MRDSKRLYEAAHNGDVRTLREIAGRYPSLLYGGSWAEAPYDRLPEPPLQVAAFFGHLDFVERILAMDPALAHHSDKKGLSPLHMAAANGRVNIITRLLRVDPDLCFLCDGDGRNPLHFAAMNGRLAALQLLVEHIGTRRDVTTFLNAKDDYGFTLLHLAVHNQHLEIVQYLVTLKIETNALNSKGLTPLDMLMDYPMPTAYPNLVKTANFLRGHGATRSSAITASATSPEIWARKKDALMVIASLIATMAFQAAVNPPGGVWQEDGNSGHIAGKSVMASKSPNLYILFIISATFAFAFSLIELTLHMSNTISNSVAAFGLVAYAKYMSTAALVAAYSISVAFLTTLPDDEQTATAFGTLFCITVVIILVFVVVALRFGLVGKGPSANFVIQFPPPT